jgi:phosphatidate phosphatase APP1
MSHDGWVEDSVGFFKRLMSRSHRSATSRESGLAVAAPRPSAVRILPFIGYGSAETIRLQGRILEAVRLTPGNLANTAWKNIGNFYRRFRAAKHPGVRVNIRVGDLRAHCVTGAEGYFQMEGANSAQISSGWHDAEFEVPDIRDPHHGATTATGQLLIPSADARVGIISDLDDTVVKTHVVSRLRMLANVALRNARTRIPFAGVGAFYRALQQGRSGDEANPLFYVSACPWDLFDLLIEFFRIQKIPLGPMLLQRYNLKTLLSHEERDAHKRTSIASLLEFYPHLPFILIGDSGERDPEIYTRIARRFPHRIRAIYIRDIAARRRHESSIRHMARELKQFGIPLVLTQDSEAAAEHAAAVGLIPSEALDEVRSRKRVDARRS